MQLRIADYLLPMLQVPSMQGGGTAASVVLVKLAG